MSLSVCWLLDEDADRAVRSLWRRLEEAEVTTLLSHTHGRHVPHLTLASLTTYDVMAVRRALADLPEGGPLRVRFEALGAFPRVRCWLAAVPDIAMLQRQQAVVHAVQAAGAEAHRHYQPGEWLPHLTLAPRLRLAELTTVAGKVNEVLPLPATLSRAALVNTGTGQVDVLPHLV